MARSDAELEAQIDALWRHWVTRVLCVVVIPAAAGAWAGLIVALHHTPLSAALMLPVVVGVSCLAAACGREKEDASCR